MLWFSKCLHSSHEPLNQKKTMVLLTEALHWPELEQAPYRVSCSPLSNFWRSDCNYPTSPITEGQWPWQRGSWEEKGLEECSEAWESPCFETCPAMAHTSGPMNTHGNCSIQAAERAGTRASPQCWSPAAGQGLRAGCAATRWMLWSQGSKPSPSHQRALHSPSTAALWTASAKAWERKATRCSGRAWVQQ